MADLNRSSPLPLYAQLARQVEARIFAGTYLPGAAIPSENALCDEFGVGRPTVRQATAELIKKGYLERRRGAGTFVKKQGEVVDLFSLGGTIRSFSDQGLNLSTRIVAGPSCELFEQRPMFSFERIGYLERTPVLHERFWFDQEVFADLDQLSLEGESLSRLVHAHFGLSPLGADQIFRAIVLDADQAALLGQEAGQAALLVERHLHFSTAKDAVFVQMLCRQDERFSFAQSLGG